MNHLQVTPALIPHNEFHTGIWLLSVNRPEWYYFMKKRNPDSIKTKFFLKSVDPPLRKLVGWLHKSGIKTTPSCSGHHASERNFEKIYNALEKDMDDIRGKGLNLKDVESGSIYHYQNSHYILPWTRAEFIESALAYQKKGVMGLKLGNRRVAKRKLKELNIPGVSIKERNNILFIFTRETEANKITDMWHKVTGEVIKALKPVQ